MSANVEWNIPFTIEVPVGGYPGTGGNEINLNTTTPGDRFLLDRGACLMGPGLVSGSALRVTRDFIPQADGEIVHNDIYEPGYEARLAIQLWNNIGADDSIDVEPACDAQLRTMMERLSGAAYKLLRTPGRLHWSPTGYGDTRALDRIKLMSWPVPQVDEADGLCTVTFEVYTGFPYAIDLTPGTPSTLGAGVLHNAGNHDIFPVFQIHGATNSVTIFNNTVLDENGVPLQFTYNQGLPGGVPIPGGSYAEIDCFRNTVYMNGNGANLKAGIDMVTSEFFWLQPGDNDVTVTWNDGTGSGVNVLWNNAFA